VLIPGTLQFHIFVLLLDAEYSYASIFENRLTKLRRKSAANNYKGFGDRKFGGKSPSSRGTTVKTNSIFQGE